MAGIVAAESVVDVKLDSRASKNWWPSFGVKARRGAASISTSSSDIKGAIARVEAISQDDAATSSLSFLKSEKGRPGRGLEDIVDALAT
jgi:hypothetical protein